MKYKTVKYTLVIEATKTAQEEIAKGFQYISENLKTEIKGISKIDFKKEDQ